MTAETETDADAVDVRDLPPGEFLEYLEMREAEKRGKLAAIRKSVTESGD